MAARFRRRMMAAVFAATLGGVGLELACGPGDLSRLTEGDGSVPPGPPEVVDNCRHAFPPQRPDGGSETNLPELDFAAEDMRLENGPDGKIAKPVGLDLDQTCSTCAADAPPPSCVGPPDASACDDSNGRDNVTGPLIATVNLFVPTLSPAFLTSRIAKGYFTMLIGVLGWNGEANDPKVIVTIRMSPGVDGEKDINGDVPPPQFKGEDVWSIEPSSISDGDRQVGMPCNPTNCGALAVDLNGYVVKNKLVARFDEVPFAFGDGTNRIAIPYRSAVLLADLTKVDTSYRLSGELAGRWTAADILGAVARLSFTDVTKPDAPTQSLCQNPVGYGYFKSQVCGAVDLAGRQAQDRTGAKCTAMSQSVGFTASPAKLGLIRSSTTQTGSSACPTNLDTSCGN